MADLLLNGLTNGRHGKLVSQQQRRGEEGVKKDKEKKSSCEGGLERDVHERSVPWEGEDSGREARKELGANVMETEGRTGGPPEAGGTGSQGDTVEGPGVTARANVSQKYAELTTYRNCVLTTCLPNLICVNAIIACTYSWLACSTCTHAHAAVGGWGAHERLHVCGCCGMHDVAVCGGLR